MPASDEVRAFLSAAGKKGGSSKSLAKQFAARRNGKLARKPAEQPAPPQPEPAEQPARPIGPRAFFLKTPRPPK